MMLAHFLPCVLGCVRLLPLKVYPCATVINWDCIIAGRDWRSVSWCQARRAAVWRAGNPKHAIG